MTAVTSGGNGHRFAAVPLTQPGTAASAWVERLAAAPRLDLSECTALTIVAPHPDDETLGLGATAAMLRARGVPVRAVVVSDGGAAYPHLSPLERTWLERDRRAETTRAAALLGLGEPEWLGLPDGDLASRERELADALAERLTTDPVGAWCAATWRGDGHPDHEAVGRATAVACARTAVRSLEYPIWMWHWATPTDSAIPWSALSVVDVDAAAAARKRLAVREFRTQLATGQPDAVLPDFVIQRVLTVGEVVFG
jgi:LmbE family N-acetylglucosaminyl deacetylase